MEKDKEKKGKKITAVIITAALIVIILLCLVCCQSGGGNGDPTGNTTNTAGTTTAATTEGAGDSEPGTDGTQASEATTEATTGNTEPSTETTQPTTEVTEGTEPTEGADPTEETEPPVTEPPKESEPPHVHSYTSVVTAPTCTAEGYTTHTCACGNSYIDDRTPAKGHSWGDWVVVREPTTSAEGLKERSCTACSAKESQSIPKLVDDHTHHYVLTSSVEPTCCSEGSKTYSCTCGDSYTETLPAVDHNWVHSHTEEEGHYEGYIVCHCGGFEFAVELANANPKMFADAWSAHVEEARKETGTTAGHSYYNGKKWVVDKPSQDIWTCSYCQKVCYEEP